MPIMHKLNAFIRKSSGKNSCRKLRAAGSIPAVFYTGDGENKLLQIKETELMRVYKEVGKTTMFNLIIHDGNSQEIHPCLVWDTEYYPTRQRFQHLDFYGVDLEKAITIRIPLEFVGSCKGVKAGGKLELYRDQIDVSGKPALLPQKITVDVSDLDINEGLRIEDLAMPEGIQAQYDDNFVILHVNAPGGSESEEEEEEKEEVGSH